jgi:hypothetical protein
MKVETVEVNGVKVNKGEEHLADKWGKGKAPVETPVEPDDSEGGSSKTTPKGKGKAKKDE